MESLATEEYYNFGLAMLSLVYLSEGKKYVILAIG